MNINKKCISPIIAILLLFTVTIVSIISFQAWYVNYQTIINSNVENAFINDFNSISIESLNQNLLYILNNGENPIEIKEIKVNSQNCDFNPTLDAGINEVNLGNCLENINTAEQRITIVTDNGIQEKIIYNKNPDYNPYLDMTCVDLSSNIVGLWRMDGNWNDSSLNNNDGITNGGISFAEGRFGQAGQFDGIDDYINLGNPSELNLSGNFTVLAWVKPSSLNQENPILHRYAYNSGKLGGYYFKIYNISPSLINSASFGIYGYNMGGAVQHGSHTNDNLPYNTWNHILVTFENNTSKIYIDGVLEASYPNRIHSISDAPLTLGRRLKYKFPVYNYLNGSIDEVAIYDRALNSSETSEIYTQGNSGQNICNFEESGSCINITDDLVGLWHLDGSWSDTSVNNNDAIAYNGADFTTGKNGQAVQFDGVDDYVDLTNNLKDTITDNFTISLWVKINSSSLQEGVISNLKYTDYGDGIYSPTDGYAIDISNNDTWFSFYHYDPGRIGSSYQNADWSQSPIINITKNWHMLTGVLSGASDRKIYVNDEYVGLNTGPNGNDMGPLNGDISMGLDHYGNYYNGLIDELVILDKDLTGGEIRNLYEASKYNITLCDP